MMLVRIVAIPVSSRFISNFSSWNVTIVLIYHPVKPSFDSFFQRDVKTFFQIWKILENRGAFKSKNINGNESYRIISKMQGRSKGKIK